MDCGGFFLYLAPLWLMMLIEKILLHFHTCTNTKQNISNGTNSTALTICFRFGKDSREVTCFHHDNLPQEEMMIVHKQRASLKSYTNNVCAFSSFLPSYSPANTYCPTCIMGLSLSISIILHVPRHLDRKSLLIIPESSTTTSCSWTHMIKRVCEIIEM